tara:strand:- start:390 stop:548 length:159 start_codon:yes stop_codon:yes gene_type:complete
MTNKKYTIKVSLSEEDMHQLQSGDIYFKWTYQTEEDETVAVDVVLDMEVIND